MKKHLLLLFLSVLPLMVSAAAVKVNGQVFKLNVETHEATIAKSGADASGATIRASYSGDVTIPSSIDYEGVTYKVTGIDDGTFSVNASIKSVSIPSTVTTIGDGAFSYCSELASIVIPNSVTYLGANAFFYCEKLKTAELSANLASIEESTFTMCSSLTSIAIPGSVKYIDDGAFASCRNLATCTIEEGPTSMGKSVFDNVIKLTSLVIPNSVTTIGESLCFGCSGLTSVTIGNGVVDIPKNAFYGCNQLVTLSLGASVASCHEMAFRGCSAVTDLYNYAVTPRDMSGLSDLHLGNITLHVIPAALDAYKNSNPWCYFSAIVPIEGYGESSEPEPYAVLSDNNHKLTFYYDKQKAARGGVSVGPFEERDDVSWANDASLMEQVVFDPSFAECTSITSTAFWFYMMSNVTQITGLEYLNTSHVTNMQSMFEYCDKLTTLDLSHFDTGNVTHMGSMFETCSSLTELDVTSFNTENVVEMGGMFVHCQQLTTLDLTGFDTGKLAGAILMFGDCPKLTTILCNDTWNPEISSMMMFAQCPSLPGYSSDNANDATFAKPTSKGGYFTATVEPGPESFTSSKGLTYTVIEEGKVMVRAADTGLTGSVAIPEVARNTQTGKSYTVTAIETEAFAGCSAITGITIPKSVVTIGGTPFVGCSSLTGFEVLAGSESYTAVDGVLYSADLSVLVAVPAQRSGSFTLSDKTTVLADGAFDGCSQLTELIASQENPIETNDKVFSGVDFDACQLVVPFGAAASYRNAQGWRLFVHISGEQTIEVEGNVITVSEDGDVVFKSANPETAKGDYTIPQTIEVNGKQMPVTEIADGAFENCSDMTSCTIPEGVTKIGKHPFRGCNKLEELHVLSPLPINIDELMEARRLLARRLNVTVPEALEGIDFETCVLYVPFGYEQDYREAEGWKLFKHIVGVHAETDPALTLTAQSYTREYGEENPAFEFTAEGATLDGAPEIECEATVSSPVGTYDIVIKKGGVKNYNDTYVKGVLTITKAQLTVTVADAEREQGQENPPFAISYSGWKNGDSEAGLTKKPIAITEATSESAAGEYAIELSGGEADNYELVYQNGKLTVIDTSAIDMFTAGVVFDIYDVSGRKVRSKVTSLGGLPKGVYIVNGRKVVLR